MTNLMQPRQTLLDCARNEARSLSNKHKYDFFDRLEDGSLQIAASGERKNRPAAGGLNAFCMVGTWPQPQQLRVPVPVSAAMEGDRGKRLSTKSSSDRGLDQQLRTRMV
jgi:hypothetical protein